MADLQVPEAIERDLIQFRKVLATRSRSDIYDWLYKSAVTDPDRRRCPCMQINTWDERVMWIHGDQGDGHRRYNALIYRELRTLSATELDKVREWATAGAMPRVMKKGEQLDRRGKMLIDKYLTPIRPLWFEFADLETAGSV